jgi:hypothetical protein
VDNWLIDLIVYITFSLPLFIIAKKSEHPYAWVAFIPVFDFWLICDMADVSVFLGLLYVFPYVNLLVHMYIWSRISENTNKSPLWGILMPVPVVSIIVGFYLALYEPADGRY